MKKMLFVAVLVLVAIVAACSSNQGGNSGSGNSGAGGGNAGPVNSGENNPPPKSAVTLEFATNASGSTLDAYKELADAFESRAARPAAAPMQQEAFSDYHLYTLGRKTTINNAETKQVSMLGATAFPVVKRYVVNGQRFYYHDAQQPGAPIKDVVQVFYQFRNEEKAGLGMPMPSGTVRVYQSDSQGGVQFVGEDRIDHTPKDETINLKIGNAFDVIAERKQTDFQKISSNVYDVEYEITLRNHKVAPITVEVNEPIGGTWRMQRSSHEWTKTSAWAAQFMVPVAADQEAVLKYRVRVTY